MMDRADKAHIVAAGEIVPVGDLTPHPDNPRRGDIPAIMASLTRFGQQKPIVVDAEGKVIAGNHILQAAKKLGWKTIAITRGGLEGDDSRAYLLADNRTTDRAKYKNTALADFLQTQMDADNLEGTGYSLDDVEGVLAEAGAGEQDGPDVPPSDKKSTADVGGNSPREPLRDIQLTMTQSQARTFGSQIRYIKKHHNITTQVGIVCRAMEEMAKSAGWTSDMMLPLPPAPADVKTAEAFAN